MKAIMVMFDSLNRHLLPPYGCSWVHAPNFERLAQRTMTFDKSYVGSMPCMPARRELHTGRYNFLHRSWGPLEPFDDSMPELLKRHGIYTHLVSDHQHYWQDGGATYHNRYSSWEIVRGQEGDFWKGHVADPEIPDDALGARPHAVWRQDWVNRSYQASEAEQPQAQTFELGLEFIRRNHREQDWFLQIETFDPHEPFFTQQYYKDLYPHDYAGPHFDWPEYRQVEETPEQVEHVRNEYAALVSMCDAHLGKVLDLMDALHLWDDTMLIVNTDHGYLLGEHGWWAKVIPPFFEEVAHTPLFLWDPRSRRAGERCAALVQTIDLAPTLLEYFGVATTEDMQGVPLPATMAADRALRRGGLFGIHGGHVNYTDGRYVLMLAPAHEENRPLFDYTLMPTHMDRPFGVEELASAELAEPFTFTKDCPVLKVRAASRSAAHDFGTLLYDLEVDPQQRQPISDPELERKLIAEMVALMRANDAPPEQYVRLGLAEPEMS